MAAGFSERSCFQWVPSLRGNASFQFYINPPYESLKEFTVLQAHSRAIRPVASVAQYQLKSGTNAIHGDVFAIYRDAFFDAAGAFNDVNGTTQVSSVRQTQITRLTGHYGRCPVLLPKLYMKR